jgi:hypothetical protein
MQTMSMLTVVALTDRHAWQARPSKALEVASSDRSTAGTFAVMPPLQIYITQRNSITVVRTSFFN